jgi:hypothetical protein
MDAVRQPIPANPFRDWKLWAGLSAACLLTQCTLVWAATRIPMPDVGCTAPLPAGKSELVHEWVAAVDRVTGVAGWFGVASVAALLVGFALSRGRARLFLVGAPVLIVAVLAHAYVGDIVGAWCADN